MSDITRKSDVYDIPAQYLHFKAAKSGVIQEEKYHTLASGVQAVIAQYNDYSDSNPYYTTSSVSALPPILDDQQFAELATYYPPVFTDVECSLSPTKKYYRARSIAYMFHPTDAHFKLFRAVDEALRERYAEKVHAGQVNNDQGGISIYGISGMGKTVAVNIILSYFPQVVIHPEMNNELQVNWLKITCPHRGGDTALCHDVLAAADKLLGTTYKDDFKKALGNQGDLSISTYIDRVKKLIEEINLGILVIDEIQFLAKSSDKDEIVKFLIKLRNDLGIPVIYIGTFELEGVYDDLPMAYVRKGSSLGDEYFEPFELTKTGKIPQSFHNLVAFLFDQYQITHSKTPFSEELSKVFYQETGGILFVIINLFILVQQRINKLEEQGKNNLKITKKRIADTATSSFRQLKPYIQALVTGNKEQLKKMKDIDVSKYRLRDLAEKYKPSADIERHVSDVQRRHGLEGQLTAILRQSDVPEKQTSHIVKAILDSYNGEPQHELVMKALQMYAEMQKKPDKPLQLSPEIERAQIDLSSVDLEKFDAFATEVLEKKAPELVPDILLKHGLGYDLVKELDL
ncbi:hypothetical protein ACH42_01595 [Endozoicomonas sp. (ex Bugula neritina AB1)]|nr:hypothetical protein ACH42_01595 [Endozoicomonas sp. (ex Bugula neritina AB1)]